MIIDTLGVNCRKATDVDIKDILEQLNVTANTGNWTVNWTYSSPELYKLEPVTITVSDGQIQFFSWEANNSNVVQFPDSIY